MITAIRKQFKGESLKYALWVILVALAVGYLLPLLIKDSKGGRWMIRVNDSEISDVSFAMQVAQEQQRLAYIREKYGQYADLLLKSQGLSTDPRALAYEYLVDVELLNQAGQKLGVHIGEDYITESISNPMFVMRDQALVGLIPPAAFTPGGGLNMEVVQTYLSRQGITGAQFESIVERALMRRVVTEILSSALYVPSFDVLQRYITEYVGKKYSIVTVSLDSLIKKQKENPASDTDIEQFFNLENTKNKRYWVPEKRSGVLWTFNMDQYGIQPSEESITAYYEKNKMNAYVDQPVKIQVRRIVLPVKNEAERETIRAQAEQLRADLVANPDQFAKKSEVVPFFAKGESGKGNVFEQAAFSLTQAGAISPVISTESGFEVIQLDQRKSRTFKPLNAVRKEIVSTLRKRRFQDAFTDDMKRVMRAGESKKDALEALAKSKGASMQKLEGQTKDVAGRGKKLFGLKKEGISYFTEDGVGYALQLIDIAPDYAPSLASVKSTVLQDLYEHKARKKLERLFEEAKKEASSVSVQELAQKVDGTIEKTGWLTAQDNKGLDSFLNKGIPVYEMLQMEKVGAALVTTTDSAGFIIKLEEIQPVDADDFRKNEKDLKKNLEAERKGALILGFVASLARTARIEINEMLMQQLS